MFAGKDVVIFPDNDEPGQAHAQRGATSLRGIAASVRIAKVPRARTSPSESNEELLVATLIAPSRIP